MRELKYVMVVLLLVFYLFVGNSIECWLVRLSSFVLVSPVCEVLVRNVTNWRVCGLDVFNGGVLVLKEPAAVGFGGSNGRASKQAHL